MKFAFETWYVLENNPSPQHQISFCENGKNLLTNQEKKHCISGQTWNCHNTKCTVMNTNPGVKLLQMLVSKMQHTRLSFDDELSWKWWRYPSNKLKNYIQFSCFTLNVLFVFPIPALYGITWYKDTRTINGELIKHMM